MAIKDYKGPAGLLIGDCKEVVTISTGFILDKLSIISLKEDYKGSLLLFLQGD